MKSKRTIFRFLILAVLLASFTARAELLDLIVAVVEEDVILDRELTIETDDASRLG